MRSSLLVRDKWLVETVGGDLLGAPMVQLSSILVLRGGTRCLRCSRVVLLLIVSPRGRMCYFNLMYRFFLSFSFSPRGRWRSVLVALAPINVYGFVAPIRSDF